MMRRMRRCEAEMVQVVVRRWCTDDARALGNPCFTWNIVATEMRVCRVPQGFPGGSAAPAAGPGPGRAAREMMQSMALGPPAPA